MRFPAKHEKWNTRTIPCIYGIRTHHRAKSRSRTDRFNSRRLHHIEFRVGYCSAEGGRKFKTFADFEKARDEARSILESVATGNLHALTLTNQDKAIYERAIEALKTCAMPLDSVAMEYAECRRIMGEGSIKTAVQEYVARHR